MVDRTVTLRSTRSFSYTALNPSRALGQNFVGDANTVRRIARLAEVGAGDRVVEIGPGLGSLTLALLETGAAVTAVEMDRFLIPVLRQMVEPKGATVVHADALEVDWPALLGNEPGWVLVANLPYNVATPLVLKVLDEAPMVQRLLVMVQREVGERLAATPGSKAYGAVSVKVAWSATASVVGKVPPTVFVPAAQGRLRARACSNATPRWATGKSATQCSSSSKRVSPRAARCCATPSRFGRRRRASTPPASSRPSAPSDSTSPHGEDSRRAARVLAPAKLTLSLRVTGVRDDGYHLIDAEMVSVDFCDTLAFADGDGLDRHRRARFPRATTSSSGRCARSTGRRTSRWTSRFPQVRVLAVGRRTPRPCCAGRASTTSRSRRRSVATCRSACAAGAPA